MKIQLSLLLIFVVGLIAQPAGAADLTYEDLIQRMDDLQGLATLPLPGEQCAQWSSYDRKARYDEATGMYVDWKANGDGNGLIRMEGDSQVLAEMEGPGCLWRIWSALPEKGHVKIFLDGKEMPAVDLPFEDYFKGNVAPFDYPTLSYGLDSQGCRGKNLYFPIPYQKSCKVIAEPGWGRYYHFTYTTFPEGTNVPTFSTELAKEAKESLTRLDKYFADSLGTLPQKDNAAVVTEKKTIEVAAGDTTKVIELTGPQAITQLRLFAEFGDREDEMAAFRNLVLRITWDGQSEPAVWCPLGDFFGTTPGVNLYKSLPTGMTEDGFYSLWYMPFAKSATIEILNEGAVNRKFQLEITHEPLERSFDGLGHFHCKWHRDVFPVSEDRFPDWTMLQTTGRGRFCGVMLHVWHPRGGAYAPAGEGRYWWGEGDEKFFVDGEKFPSTFGTGSEDYFGYAWGNAGLFQTPYHCQTMSEGNRGHQSLLRWQIADNIPFQKSFEGCIEKYFPNDLPTLYACTVVWYLSPDGTDPHGTTPADQRYGYFERPPMESDGITVIDHSGGTVEIQGMSHFKASKWQGNDHIWWKMGKPGDKLRLSAKVPEDGTYEVSVILTKARDYGIVQFYLGDKKVSEPIDLYNAPEVIKTEPISLGKHSLKKGDLTLTVELVGANEQAIKSYMFGIDLIELKPVGQ